MKLLLHSINNYIGTITFNNDEKRNALSFKLLEEFIEALDLFKRNRVRAVIIRAKPGSKVWSAGLSIDELPEPGKDPLTFNHPLERVLREIEAFPAPVIAMAEGSIWGGACDLATTCDIITGTKDTTFAITPARIGVAYNSSGILHVIRVFGLHTAKEMFFTARPISAEKAERMGALNHLLDHSEIEAFTYKLAKTIAYNSPLSVSVAKKQITVLAKSMPVNPGDFELIDELRNKAFNSYDYVEGKKAFIEKRHPDFMGE
jgi:methylmalonyl-CoA decarboxylase